MGEAIRRPVMPATETTNTGQSTALVKISPTLSTTSVEDMFAKVARATALPNTSWAPVVTAPGVIVKTCDISRSSRLSRGRSIKRCGEAHRPSETIGGGVSNSYPSQSHARRYVAA
jgi:hypothetical protein